MKKSQYVILAEKTILNYILYNKKNSQINFSKEITENLKKKKACFVSIHKKDGSLRGCIGTIYPYRKSLYEEIIYNAVAASTEDPRFPSITKEELDTLVINVDILSEPVLINKLEELNPKKYGVIVSDDYRKGVLLPDLEGVSTIEEQLNIAKNKAGIYKENSEIDIYKFTVERYY